MRLAPVASLRSETMHTTMANPETPNLRIGIAGQEAWGSGVRSLRHCERASVYINRHDFPVLTGLHVRTDVLWIEVIPTSCVLCKAVARLPSLHRFSRRLPRRYRKGLLCYWTRCVPHYLRLLW